MNKIIKLGMATFTTIFIMGSLFSYNDNTASASTHHVTKISVHKLANKMNNDNLKKGYYKTSVQFVNQDNWTSSHGYKKVEIKDKNGSLLVYTTNKQFSKLAEGTKAKVTFNAKNDNFGGNKVLNLHISKMKITNKSSNSSSIAEQSNEKLQKDLNAKKDQLNKATQESTSVDVIHSIDHPYDNTYHINLDNYIQDGSNAQIKSVLNSINSQFIDVFENDGKPDPVLRYYVDGTEIAKNTLITDASKVKLEN